MALTLLLLVVYFGWRGLGSPAFWWFWIAVGITIDHQVFTWLCWRLELRESLVSKTLGFKIYLGLFLTLFFGRFVTLFALGWVDRGSLGLEKGLLVFMTTLLLVPGLYAMYSVMRYFGFPRASGADHFDSKYREMPLVQKGIFRFTNNAMYWWAFMLFWAIAIGLNSSAALLVAGYSHLYIWVHYHATEKPDMEYLYGGPERKEKS